jgi:hypothetical protein
MFIIFGHEWASGACGPPESHAVFINEKKT